MEANQINEEVNISNHRLSGNEDEHDAGMRDERSVHFHEGTKLRTEQNLRHIDSRNVETAENKNSNEDHHSKSESVLYDDDSLAYSKFKTQRQQTEDPSSADLNEIKNSNDLALGSNRVSNQLLPDKYFVPHEVIKETDIENLNTQNSCSDKHVSDSAQDIIKESFHQPQPEIVNEPKKEKQTTAQPKKEEFHTKQTMNKMHSGTFYHKQNTKFDSKHAQETVLVRANEDQRKKIEDEEKNNSNNSIKYVDEEEVKGNYDVDVDYDDERYETGKYHSSNINSKKPGPFEEEKITKQKTLNKQLTVKSRKDERVIESNKVSNYISNYLVLRYITQGLL